MKIKCMKIMIGKNIGFKMKHIIDLLQKRAYNC